MIYKLTAEIWSRVLAVVEADGTDDSSVTTDAVKMASHTGILSLAPMVKVVALRRLLEQNLKNNASLHDESRRALRRAIPALYSQSQ